MRKIVYEHNIDPDMARHNTGVEDCCDACAIERRTEYMRMKGAADESTVYGIDCPSGKCEM